MVNSLYWMTDWTGRWPSLGSDEFFRHTLVLPWPVVSPRRVDEEGTPYFRALVLVVRPWWLCVAARHKDARDYIRHERALNAALQMLPEDFTDEQFNDLVDFFDEIRPPWPKSW